MGVGKTPSHTLYYIHKEREEPPMTTNTTQTVGSQNEGQEAIGNIGTALATFGIFLLILL